VGHLNFLYNIFINHAPVSEFFGIAIYMYYNDHMPPHFLAEYGEHEAIYEIDTLDVTRGGLPRRAHALCLSGRLYIAMNSVLIGNVHVSKIP
jgi:hypothetical protein